MMKTPKLVFRYSPIYDVVFSGEWPSKEERVKANQLVSKLQKEWNKKSKKVLLAMSKITGLDWPIEHIECYLSYRVPYAFSEPLTLKIFGRSISRYIVTLIHELCHVLIWGNKDKAIWPLDNKGIFKKYEKEPFLTRNHLVIEALVQLTVKKVFSRPESYLKWERWWERKPKNPRAKWYKKAWEIVQKEGAENVLSEIIIKKGRK